MRKVAGVMCVVLLASIAGVAGVIPFSGSGSSGVVSPGQPFAYNFDGGVFEPDWGIPGVANGVSDWNGPTIDQFAITFDPAVGISLDPLNLGTACNGGSYDGDVFCASPFSQTWRVTTLSTDSITFTALPGGDLLINADPLSVNVFFTGGDFNGASFSGDWVTPVPEPGGIVLFGSAILGLAGIFRRKLLL